ncbi:helix-turn-helix domain-containing protein [Phragmitibacter flavus]|uniref:Helix-turn-helix domain-containing protein n=1 Tax=Phragmitibacter flavus TaxID=2576071 RepID=A0A5R8K8Q3_9BACT|nr:AraC family transcriptional regulator [Phragmitibacter flavus]TLD68714.1 helix-turn-helix domain-containing protein [Phragmitibacter flavus]
MEKNPVLPTKEITINGPRTQRWTLQGDDCSELATHGIARLGIDHAFSPYCRVRLRPTGSFFLACLEGEGSMLLEGHWERIKPGSLCLAPPRVLNALHAEPPQKWTFAWIRYEEPPWTKPLVGAASPLRLTQGAEDLGRMIQGLRAEWLSDKDPAQIHHWLSLIHGYIRRLVTPWRSSSRIAELWQLVARDLTIDWKLNSLAEQSHISAEHLRRLCLRELGRTPMEHITYMRIQKAKELLETTDEKLEAIAPQVGYHSATVFSRAFIRCVGMSPTTYRSGTNSVY